MDSSYIYIVELGKRLISYKMMRQQKQRAVRTQVASINSLNIYLRDNQAELVNQKPPSGQLALRRRPSRTPRPAKLKAPSSATR